MTYEEAYKQCEEFFESGGIGQLDGVAFNMALNSMHKQIPKKLKNQNEYCMGECPNCDGYLDVNGVNRFPVCPWCGQAIDWSK